MRREYEILNGDRFGKPTSNRREFKLLHVGGQLIPCNRIWPDRAEYSRQTSTIMGDETVQWDAGHTHADSLSSGAAKLYATRLGEEHNGHNNLGVFEWPDSGFTHYKQTGSINIKASISAFHSSRINYSPGDPDGSPLNTSGGNPVARLHSTQFKTDNGTSWANLETVQSTSQQILYRNPPVLGDPLPRGTTVDATTSVASLSDLIGKNIGVDFWFELDAYSMAITMANPTAFNHKRTVYLDDLSHPPFNSNAGTGGGNQTGIFTVESGLRYAHKFDSTKHSWELEPSGDPNSLPILTDYHGGITTDDITFSVVHPCYVSVARFVANDPPNQSTFRPVERWAVWFGHLWPEVEHWIEWKHDVNQQIFTDSAYYRPTSWNGVADAVFTRHTSASVYTAGGTSSATAAGMFPVADVPFMPPSQRVIDNINAPHLHPASFTLRRVNQ